MRNLVFAEKEFYHLYNRGVDKRNIFIDQADLSRFLESIEIFNNKDSVGSLRDASRHPVSGGEPTKKKQPLVKVVAYCLNPNHFHLILKQTEENGIERFMHKLGMGYAKYFNTKYGRLGTLFQGRFGAKLIDSNEYLLHLSAYINLNHSAHSSRHPVSGLSQSSWEEYAGNARKKICDTGIILEQFKNKKAYKKFAEGSLKSIVERKILLEELESAGIELVNA